MARSSPQRRTGPVPGAGALSGLLAEVARDAGRDAGLAPDLLEDLLPELVASVRAGRRPDRAGAALHRSRGAAAARDGVDVSRLLDLHLSGAARLWARLPDAVAAGAADDGGAVAPPAASRPVQTGAAAQVLLEALRDVVAAVLEGHEDVRRQLLLGEVATRQEFVDDLLTGSADVAGLLERAATYGLALGGEHAVAVVESAVPYVDGSATVRQVEAALRRQLPGWELLVATRSGVLVCVVGVPAAAAARVVADLRAGLSSVGDGVAPAGSSWRAGVGGTYAGPVGVQRSYRDACEAVDLAGRLGLPERVVDAASLLVHRVLLRDRVAMADLVATVLGPLASARGGPEPLLAALAAYFDARGVAVAAAERLPLSVRALTYRLERVRVLTGHDVADPAQRYALQTAVLGARLLDWPRRPLPVER